MVEQTPEPIVVEGAALAEYQASHTLLDMMAGKGGYRSLMRLKDTEIDRISHLSHRGGFLQIGDGRYREALVWTAWCALKGWPVVLVYRLGAAGAPEGKQRWAIAASWGVSGRILSHDGLAAMNAAIHGPTGAVVGDFATLNPASMLVLGANAKDALAIAKLAWKVGYELVTTETL